MADWLVEVKGKKGAHRGFLVSGHRVSRPQAIERLKALENATEISGQVVEVEHLNLETVEVRNDATERHANFDRFSVEGRVAI